MNDELAVMANCGIYQWIILIITGFLTGLFAMHMFIPVFNHGDPMFRCVISILINNLCLYTGTLSFTPPSLYPSSPISIPIPISPLLHPSLLLITTTRIVTTIIQVLSPFYPKLDSSGCCANFSPSLISFHDNKNNK